MVSGALSITNNGNHGGTPMIDAGQSQVIVRCSPISNQSCLNADPGQIIPGAQPNNVAPMMDREALQRFKQRAIVEGHHFVGCPTPNASGNYDLSGAVVWSRAARTRPTSRARS